MRKIKGYCVFIVISLILLPLPFMCGVRDMKRYNCITNHKDTMFEQVYLIGEEGLENTFIHYLDKGKSIYDRYYEYNGKYYKTEINRKEFDDNFYICIENPNYEYSDTDIENAFRYCVFGVIFMIFDLIVLLVLLQSIYKISKHSFSKTE